MYTQNISESPNFTPSTGVGSTWKDASGKVWKYTAQGWVSDSTDVNADAKNKGTFDVGASDNDLTQKLLAGGSKIEEVKIALVKRKNILSNAQALNQNPQIEPNNQYKPDLSNPFNGMTRDQALLDAFNKGVHDPSELDKIGKTYDMLAGNEEVSNDKIASVKTIASDIQLLEQARQKISPLLRGAGQAVKSKFRILNKGEIDSFEGLKGNVAYSLAQAISGQTGRSLSDTDIKTFLNALPGIEDSEVGAENKLRNISLQIKSRLISAGIKDESAQTYSDALLSNLGLLPNGQPIVTDKNAIEQPQDQTGEKKSVEGFVGNVIRDIQENFEGLPNIPKVAMKLSKEMASQTPSILGPGIDAARTETGKAIITGFVNEYKNLITHPLEQAYNHPVNTILDVIPLIPVGKNLLLTKTSKLLKSGEIESAIGSAGKISESTKAIDKASIASRATELLPNAEKLATKTFSSAFIIPTKRAKSLNPRMVADKMLEYGVSGSFDEMSSVANKVTGSDGILSKVTRDAIGGLSGELDFSNVVPAAKKTLEKIIDLTEQEENKILLNIGGTEKSGSTIGKMNPLDAYDVAKGLEAQGHQYLNTSTYLTRNLKAEQIGKAYLNAADEIILSLEDMAKNQKILAQFKNEDVLSKLKEISPKLAQEFESSKTLAEVRKLQSPFVKLNQMIDLTEQAANSAFQSTGRQIAGRTTAALAGGLVGSPMGPLGTLIGTLGGAVFGPIVEASIESSRPSILTKLAKTMKKISRRN